MSYAGQWSVSLLFVCTYHELASALHCTCASLPPSSADSAAHQRRKTTHTFSHSHPHSHTHTHHSCGTISIHTLTFFSFSLRGSLAPLFFLLRWVVGGGGESGRREGGPSFEHSPSLSLSSPPVSNRSVFWRSCSIDKDAHTVSECSMHTMGYCRSTHARGKVCLALHALGTYFCLHHIR